MESWRFLLRQLARRLWLRASLYAVFGVAIALVAAAFSPFVPAPLAKPFGGGAVDGLLNVMASSLLTVATFSVAAMLTAYTNVSQGATPRAAALITGDRRAQGALATFIGAFLYAIVAFSALGTGYYGGGGRAILFLVTLLMLAWVAITLLRWLDQLLTLARVGHAVDQVEATTLAAVESAFGLGAAKDLPSTPAEARAVGAEQVGYVQNVDVAALRALAEACDLEVWVEAPPGVFAHARSVLARVRGPADTATLGRVRRAFTLADARSFDQDPRFGLTVLGEIAARALSPAVNDPGTAIDVIGTAVRVLTRWTELEARAEPPPADARVHLARPAYADLLDDVFTPIASYGAGALSVGLRLQKALAALAELAATDRRSLLAAAAQDALERSEAALDHAPDRVRVRQAAAWIAESAAS